MPYLTLYAARSGHSLLRARLPPSDGFHRVGCPGSISSGYYLENGGWERTRFVPSRIDLEGTCFARIRAMGPSPGKVLDSWRSAVHSLAPATAGSHLRQTDRCGSCSSMA